MLQTVDQVIAELGGPSEVAKLVGVSLPAVSNVKSRGSFPYRWRIPIMQEAQRRNLQIDPALLGLTGEAA